MNAPKFHVNEEVLCKSIRGKIASHNGSGITKDNPKGENTYLVNFQGLAHSTPIIESELELYKVAEKPFYLKNDKPIKIKTFTFDGKPTECLMIDFKEETVWMNLHLANGDILQVHVVITEIYDTGRKIDGESLYIVKQMPQLATRVIPGGHGTGEFVATDGRQGPAED